MTKQELKAKVTEWKELKALAEELAAEMGAIEDELKVEMTAQDTEEMVIDIFKIRWTSITSTRLDTTALKKALPEIAERFTKTTQSRRFTIA
jgi:predicted phage-related endonuclease